jgi:hypothetical protein
MNMQHIARSGTPASVSPRRSVRRLPLSMACALAAACVGACALPATASAAVSPPGTRAGHAEEAAALVEAVRHGRTDLVRQQVHAGVSVDACAPGDGSPLIVAAQGADRTMVDALLHLGADVNGACHGDGNPLIAAAAAGDVGTLAQLLDAGARLDAVVPGDETALITAVRGNHLAAVQYLASHGADVNLGAMADNGQWRTPLNQARGDAVAGFLRGKGATASGTPRR